MSVPSALLLTGVEVTAAQSTLQTAGPDCQTATNLTEVINATAPVDVRIARTQESSAPPQTDSSFGFQEFTIGPKLGANTTFVVHGQNLFVQVNLTALSNNPAIGGDCQGLPIVVANLNAQNISHETAICERLRIQASATNTVVNFTDHLVVPTPTNTTAFQHFAVWVNPGYGFWHSADPVISAIKWAVTDERNSTRSRTPANYHGGRGCDVNDWMNPGKSTSDAFFPTFAVHSYVVDHVPTLHATAVAWCKGGDGSDGGATWLREGAHAPTCDPDMTKGGASVDAQYNVIRYNAPDDDSHATNLTAQWTSSVEKQRAGPTFFSVKVNLTGESWPLPFDACTSKCRYDTSNALSGVLADCANDRDCRVHIHYHVGATITSNVTHRAVRIGTSNTSFLDEAGVSGVMYLYGLAENLTVTLHLDPLNELSHSSASDETVKTWPHVFAADASVRFKRTGLQTDPPMRYDSNHNIKLNLAIDLANRGDWQALNTTLGTCPPPVPSQPCGGKGSMRWAIYLDPTTRPFNRSEIHNDSLDLANWGAPHTSRPVFFNYTGSDDANASNYVSPGRHTLVVIADPPYVQNRCQSYPYCKGRGDVFESNESVPFTCLLLLKNDTATNNANCDAVPFRIFDTTAPKLTNLTANKHKDGAKFNRSEPVDFKLNMTESDPTVNVTLHLTSSTGKNVTRRMSLVSGTGQCANSCQYHVNLTGGLAELGAWAAHVSACDSSANCGNSSPITVNVHKWHVQDILLSDLYGGLANGSTIPFSANATYTFYLGTSGADKLGANATGYSLYGCDPAHGNLRGCDNYTGNKIIRYWPPNATSPRISQFSSEQYCRVPNPNPLNLPCQQYGNQSQFDFGLIFDRPGRWYFNIQVLDYSHDVVGAADQIGIRNVNVSITVKHNLPYVGYTNYPSSRNASENLHFLANVRSDFGVSEVWAHFRANNTGFSCPKCNESLNLTKDHGVNDTLNKNENWERNISTGRLGNLTVAGGYNVSIDTKDIYGFWNHTYVFFTLHDLNDPVLSSWGASPILQELHANVTFYAVATADVAFHIGLNLTRNHSQYQSVQLVNRDPAHPNNYSFTRNFSDPGNYSWRFDVIDSGERSVPGTHEGLLTIADNLPPRFDVRSPSYTDPVNHTRLSSALPTLVLFVHDTNGVDENTIRLAVGTNLGPTGAPSDVPLTAPGAIVQSTNPPGYVITYTMSALKHGDQVRVQAHANDLSPKHLLGTADFVFRIDAVAPTSNAPKFSPRFAMQDTDPQNVSLTTLFTLSAHDNLDDLASSGIKAIHYQIVKVSSVSAERIYEGPFSIGSIPHVYVGGGNYMINYWAEDGVGNTEHPRHLSVFLDDKPPELEPLGELPHGRFINATIDDNGVNNNTAGVKSATVWFRVNHGLYQPMAMSLTSGDPSLGVWSAVLPEGKMGDIFCYYLSATDNVGNSGTFNSNATNPRACYTVGNHPPTLHITEPGQGAVVKGPVLVKWTASDPDGNPLSFKVYERLAGKLNYIEVVSLGDASTQYSIDSTKLADGAYDLEVTVTDGTFVTVDSVRVSVLNAGTAIQGTKLACGGSTNCSTLRPGQTLIITATITKAGATVEAHVFKDGNLIASIAMKDDGVPPDEIAGDNVYTAAFTPTEAGAYSVEIFTKYEEDGVLKQSTIHDAAAFAVKLTPADVLSSFAALWIALVALVIACVGVAGYALVKKWKRGP